jgi:hypothetical protein
MSGLKVDTSRGTGRSRPGGLVIPGRGFPGIGAPRRIVSAGGKTL